MVASLVRLSALLSLVACSLVGRPAHAQRSPNIVETDESVVPRIASPLANSSRRPQRRTGKPAPPSDRDLRYAELARLVDAFELRNAIVRNAAELVRPSVVHIEAQKTRAAGADQSVTERTLDTSRALVEEAGSGVIVRYGDNDVVVTNRHVIHDSATHQIRIHLADGRSVQPKRILSDSSTDVAILDIDLPNLVPARIADSDKLNVGDFVLAFGSPFGLSHSVTQGIVSAKGRRDLIVGSEHVRIQNFIQTDAAINPGNSGGPLANLRGQIVGINTAIASDSGVNAGIGFAMPINIAMYIGKQLVDTGEVKTAYLGVKLQSGFGHLAAQDAGLPEPAGARISTISSGSPAEEADLRVGDVIYQFNGVTVENDSHLVQLVGLTPAGSKIPFVVYRKGQPVTIVVELRTKS